MKDLYYIALEVKKLYNNNIITRDAAKKLIRPYEEYYNEKNKEVSKKYNKKANIFNFNAFMR